MLLDVTAILTTSANLNAVVEAFDVPASSSVVAVASLPMDPSRAAFEAALDAASHPASTVSVSPSGTGPDPVVGPQPDGVSAQIPVARVPITRLPSLNGMPLLQQLSLLDRSTLAGYADAHTSQLAALIAHQPAAADVRSWWSGVSDAKKTAMAAETPELVGNLEGLPYGVRDRANRASLTQAEGAIRSQLRAGVGRAAADELNRRLHMLEQVRDALRVGSSHNARTLVALNPAGEGTAVIVIGDVTTADYVDYVIPGMFSSIAGQLGGFTAGTDRIVSDQQAWLKRLQPTDTPTVAAVAWIGYQTPNLSNVATLDLAEQGEAALTASIQGLRAVRAGNQPYLSILAHSYGSTTAMLALQRNDISVDALAVFGSPGAPAASVDQLHVADRNVWVGAAQWDPVPETGLFGSQPTSASFGAHRFGVDGIVDPVTGKQLGDAVSHNDYFTAGSESLRNLELIGIGRGDLVLAPGGSLALGGSPAKALGR